MSESDPALLAKITEMAAAYFGAAKVGADDVPRVIADMAKALTTLSGAPATGDAAPAAAKMTGAQIRRSIKPEALVSFEDGKSYKMLKRHLTKVGLTPDQYRAKWGLPKDYPMVAPDYSAARSKIARELGLGQPARTAAEGDRRRTVGPRRKQPAGQPS